MKLSKDKKIIFHVGLGKAASTYLQYHVFPFFKGVEYIQRTSYRSAPRIIRNSDSKRIFLSNEFDRQLEYETSKFSKEFPQAHVIIILRRHGAWLASQYRRAVKNGYPFSFDRYFNLQDTGDFWKIEELKFIKKLEAIDEYFGPKPLVLFYEDMKPDPLAFFHKIADYCGAHFDEEDINLSPKHRSYPEKQLIFARKMNHLFYGDFRIHFNNRILETLRRWLRMTRSYSILFFGKILPRVEKEPLVPKERLAEIDAYFENDWQQCKEFAQTKAVS